MSKPTNKTYELKTMTEPKKEHVHDFKIVGERIPATNPKYGGTTMDKAFLYRRCTCGFQKAFEYGSYQEIVKLWKTLTKST